jgi:hypothetical protein
MTHLLVCSLGSLLLHKSPSTPARHDQQDQHSTSNDRQDHPEQNNNINDRRNQQDLNNNYQRLQSSAKEGTIRFNTTTTMIKLIIRCKQEYEAKLIRRIIKLVTAYLVVMLAKIILQYIKT